MGKNSILFFITIEFNTYIVSIGVQFQKQKLAEINNHWEMFNILLVIQQRTISVLFIV